MINMNVTTELLAAYVEGNVSSEERMKVRKYLAANPELISSVLFAMEDEQNIPIETLSDEITYLKNLESLLEEFQVELLATKLHPESIAMAARNADDNLCVIRCEGIALRHYGYDVSDNQLLEESRKEGWLQSSGTSFTDIGKLSRNHGLRVSQIENATVEQISQFVSKGLVVVAFVDAGELTGDYILEKDEDKYIGECPDHVVIVQSITDYEVVIIDSYTPEHLDTYPLSQFLDAWKDSNNYMVIIEK